MARFFTANRLIVLRCGRIHPIVQKLIITTGNDRIARSIHQLDQEVKIMYRKQDRSEHLVLFDQVANIRSTMILTGRTGALRIERSKIVRVLRIAHIHAPRGREGRAHTCGARWQYAIEHINANTYCLDERGGVAHSHQVARFVLGKALRNRPQRLEHDLVFFTDRIATDAKPAETLMAIRDRFVIDRSEQLDASS